MPALDLTEVRREAQQALEHGELARLEKLAESAKARSLEQKDGRRRRPRPTARRRTIGRRAICEPGVPFDADVIARAKPLGLEAVTLGEEPAPRS